MIPSGTVLLIEREEIVIDVTRAMLERLGYRFMVAETGHEAIDIARIFDGRTECLRAGAHYISVPCYAPWKFEAKSCETQDVS